MKQFQRLVLIGAVLVTLLIIIDSIDARKKETKRKEIKNCYESETGNPNCGKNEKLKKSEQGKIEKSKKSVEYRILNSEEALNKENQIENSKHNVKKGEKSIKEGKNIKDNINPKIIKTYQKVKKYKIVEDVPAQNINSNKKLPKKNLHQKTHKQEFVDEVFKSLKKTSQKKLPKEGNRMNRVKNEELNELNGEETIFVEEGDLGKTQKKKAYKLVEVVLEDEEDENPQGNGTIEVGSEEEDNFGGIQRTESEEVIEKYKTTQTLKLPKAKKGPTYNLNNEDAEEESINNDHLYDTQEQESIQNDMPLNEDSYFLWYEDPHDPNTLQRCKPIPEDPNRQSPKKLTFYVIEEEVDGQIIKRVEPEADGVSMCEISDLLKKQFGSHDGI